MWPCSWWRGLNIRRLRQVFLLSVPDPTDYEGPNRWVFPTEDNYFVQDMVRRIAGIGIAEDLQEGDTTGGAKGAPALKRRCGPRSVPMSQREWQCPNSKRIMACMTVLIGADSWGVSVSPHAQSTEAHAHRCQ